MNNKYKTITTVGMWACVAVVGITTAIYSGDSEVANGTIVGAAFCTWVIWMWAD